MPRRDKRLAVSFGVFEQRTAAFREATPAGTTRAFAFAYPTLKLQLVVARKLFAAANFAFCFNEDAPIRAFERPAVRITGMIDPACGIASHARVDDSAIIDFKQECVRKIIGITI